MFKSGKTIQKQYISLLLAVVLVISAVFVYDFATEAATYKKGTVTGVTTTLNFRKEPVSGTVIASLRNGQSGEILDEKTVSGDKWYKMDVNDLIGWAHSDYIKVTTVTIDEDDEFEAHLVKEGFPDSYKAALRKLHAQYPNWVFEAQQTGLKWSDVIKAESKVGVNTVHNSSVASWKSTAAGAYNWGTNKWVEKDSGGWVSASEAIVKYYMDPRNFLDDTYIFQFLKHSYNAEKYTDAELSEIKSGLQKMVQGTFLAGKCGKKTYVSVLMSVGAKQGVSPYTLASMILQEHGIDGKGSSISGTVKGYEGYYNYFNIGAYATESLTAVQRGLVYAKGSGSYERPWNTREKSISGGAQFYAEGYVKKGQDTTYLKKFNVQGNFSHQYMTNVGGAASEGKLMSNAYDSNAREGKLVFKIPVYTSMPSTPCAKPTSNKNPNYMLKSLTVTEQSLTPSFEYDVYGYSLIVDYEVKSLSVSAKAVAKTSTVSGTGTHALAVGKNTIKVTCKSESGTSKVYTIQVVRKDNPIEPTIKTSAYDLNQDKTITGITSFPVTAKTFMEKFTVSNGSMKVLNAGGETVSGNVGTGHKLVLYNSEGTKKAEYAIVIYGDANGDGAVNARDLLAIQKNNIRIKKLSGAYVTAADVNRDGTVNARDLLAVQKHNINVKKIEQ